MVNETRKICKLCGKEFATFHPGTYKYRITHKGQESWYCSYSCYKKDHDKIYDGFKVKQYLK